MVPLKTIQEQSTQTKAPARGACREGQTRPRQEDLAGKRQDPGKRSLPGRLLKAYQESLPRRALRPGKIRRATSFRTRQDDDPGKVLVGGQLPPHIRAPAHPPACRHEASSGARGGSLCSQGYAVASGDEEKAIVANGGAPNGHFLHCLGNSDRHLMPLSPAVRVR